MAVAGFAEQVALAPLFHINSEHLGVDEGAAEGRVFFRVADEFGEALRKLVPDALGYKVGMRRINIGEENQ